MYRESNPETGRDVLIRPTDGGSPARPLLASAFDEHSAVISPDGQWIAFVSNETGRDEIQVTTFPEPGGRWQISNEGGTEPIWSPDGSEIFYRDGNAMVVVQITRKPEFRVLDRELLFARNYFAYRYHQQYDVSADGQRFLLIKQPDDLDEAYGFTVVINWLEELRRTLDTQK